MKCPICGTELDSKIRLDTCPICGSPIEWVEEPVEQPKKAQKEKVEEPDPYDEEPIGEKPVQRKKRSVTNIEEDSYNTGNGRKTGNTSSKTILTAGIAVLLLIGVIEGGIIIKNSIADKKDSQTTEYAQYEDEEHADGGESLVINNNTEKEDDTASAEAEAAEREAAEAEAAEKAADEEAAAEKAAKEAAAKKAAEEKAEAEVYDADYGILNSFSRARVSECWASSVVQDNTPGINNEPEMMVDGNEVTSWQEGAPGDGTGESVKFTLEQKCKVQYITFKMGNWRDQKRYDENYRPKSIRLKVGTQEFSLSFPDGKREFMVAFSKPITAQKITVEIRSTYKGSMYRDWQDCCISEMTVYKV